MKRLRDSKYVVYKDGRVYNGSKFLKTYTNKGNKYIRIDLVLGGVKEKFLLHRLVMEVYRGVSDLTVNHIDKDPTNNNLSNLEYLTLSDNIQATRTRKLPKYIGIQPNRKKWVTYTYRRTINGKRTTLKTSVKLSEVIKFKNNYENIFLTN